MLQLAGCVGVDPHDFTMAELNEMNVANDKQHWRRCVLLYSGSFQPKRSTLNALYPYEFETAAPNEQQFKHHVSTLKGMFAKQS